MERNGRGGDCLIRGIRGAITAFDNDVNEIIDATGELLQQMVEKNKIDPENVAQVIMTVTEDLTATFPAKALRDMSGWTFVPVMCMKEIPVPGSLEKCIRIMMTVETGVDQKDIQHIYLRDAIVLRPDLSTK